MLGRGDVGQQHPTQETRSTTGRVSRRQWQEAAALLLFARAACESAAHKALPRRLSALLSPMLPR